MLWLLSLQRWVFAIDCMACKAENIIRLFKKSAPPPAFDNGGPVFSSDWLRSMACQHITHIWLQKAEYPALLHEPPVESCLLYCHCFVLKKHYFLKSSGELIVMSLLMILLKILFINYNAWYSFYKDPWEKYLFNLSTRKAVFFLRICVCV